MGEGIIGSVASEKKILNLTNVPESYFNIISGYSETKPKNILLSPIKLNEEIYGVIELASITRFKDEEIHFVEEVCKTIAYSFAISKVYLDTLNMLELANLEITQIKSENEIVSTDLEELKIHMNELRIKSLDNEYIIEKINDFTIVINLDIDGNIIDVNARFEQFFQSEKKKFRHSNYREFMLENNPDLDFETLWRNLRYGVKQELNLKVNINNEEFYLNQHFLPMKDQKGRVKEIKILVFNLTNNLQ
jgi:methyl-accepting chemotaxis protein